jgi:hypothetical protein
MKNLYLLFIGFLFTFSCAVDDEDPALKDCAPTSVVLFDEAYTNFNFTSDGDGGQRVNSIDVYANTDSSFVYTYSYGTELETITITEDGSSVAYTTTFENGKLSKLSTAGGPNELAGELILEYSGSNVTKLETWVTAIDGNLYQVGHFDMTYDGSGNMSRSEINFDFIALFTIAFGSSPTDPYSPQSFGSSEYEYGSENAPNPLYGTYFMENPDMGFLKNMPINIIQKDQSGSVTGSEGFTITFDENGYPIKSTSGAFYIEATYVCN